MKNPITWWESIPPKKRTIIEWIFVFSVLLTMYILGKLYPPS